MQTLLVLDIDPNVQYGNLTGVKVCSLQLQLHTACCLDHPHSRQLGAKSVEDVVVGESGPVRSESKGPLAWE